MKIKFLQGLPGSGKSTFAREFVSKNKDWVIVNRDSLRNMRGEYWIAKQEDLITCWENHCIESALNYGLNVIVDATNFNEDRNKARYLSLKAEVSNLEMETHRIDTPLEECIKNDLKRPNSVGEKVIRDFHEKYLAPPKVIYKEDGILTTCIIVDIDGTIADKCDRNPFDWANVGNDKPKEDVINIVNDLQSQGQKLIFFSGRDGVCEKETREWLDKYFDEGYLLYMRIPNDNRKDCIIKKELFEEHIRGKYYCQCVIDDRDQVVDMWRKELGLTCLQVAEGAF